MFVEVNTFVFPSVLGAASGVKSLQNLGPRQPFEELILDLAHAKPDKAGRKMPT